MSPSAAEAPGHRSALWVPSFALALIVVVGLVQPLLGIFVGLAVLGAAVMFRYRRPAVLAAGWLIAYGAITSLFVLFVLFFYSASSEVEVVVSGRSSGA